MGLTAATCTRTVRMDASDLLGRHTARVLQRPSRTVRHGAAQATAGMGTKPVGGMVDGSGAIGKGCRTERPDRVSVGEVE